MADAECSLVTIELPRRPERRSDGATEPWGISAAVVEGRAGGAWRAAVRWGENRRPVQQRCTRNALDDQPGPATRLRHLPRAR